MSAPAWTPGPWGFGNTASYERLILGNGGKDRYVCHVTIEQIGGGFIAQSMEAEREANARLIAAAPDFAAAAASLIEAWGARTTGAQQIITGKSDADLQKQAMAAIDGLRAALTKAGAA